MIPRESIIAASLHLEPNRAAVLRDVHRAASRGLGHLVVNENMVALAMTEVRDAGLALKVSGIVGFPIGQWVWPAKAAASQELATIQNGPLAVMHGVGPWLDGTEGSAEEFAGISALSGEGEVWVMTSLSAIPAERLEALAEDTARSGVAMLILSNGVGASGLPLPGEAAIAAMAAQVGGRFKLAAVAPAGTSPATISGWLKAGADKVICTDFWALGMPSPANQKDSS